MQVKDLSLIWSAEIYVFVLDLQFLIKIIPIILKRESRRLKETGRSPAVDNPRPMRPEATFCLPAFSVFSIQFEEVLEKKKGRFKHEL